ncbi:oxidoreductase [Niallia endozanthoxylica]|uniref:Oxidoreductase n=1 Tax=Niallia endozanthoxylica TaxID=2036016 RepID=A0A5J5HQS1_9BACI|nr:oxidoreductase [Niallia endozanthoxylica]KAA9023808.1 oxidoreductase [Niallia endozanthoxylica]
MQKKKTALIAGASGLVGTELLHYLLEGQEYDQVIAIVRSPLNLKHTKLEEKIISFDDLDTYKDRFAVDDVYCCLGTTIKKAKTKESMYKIDVEYPVQMAKLASENGANQFLIVSSMNANPHSSIWYAKMKGELEEKISKVPFESISIMRPSLLLGERDEFRFGEKAGELVFTIFPFLFIGPLKKYKAIQGRTVALAMYKIAQMNKKGISIYPSEQIEQIAASR